MASLAIAALCRLPCMKGEMKISRCIKGMFPILSHRPTQAMDWSKASK